MIFFTADHHFGHANIIKHSSRPFVSVEEMDAALMANWNAVVKPQDTVYVVGDLFFRNTVSAEDYLRKLNGKKHLIVGNHDRDWMKKLDLLCFFESVERLVELNGGTHRLTLCHYPMMTWNHVAKGAYMIHGHIHNNTDAEYFTLIRNMSNILNAGVDVNGYYPVSFDTLLRNNEEFKNKYK